MTAQAKIPDQDLREYRSALGCFATGVAVVTAEHEGEMLGMTINSFSSVSLEPTLVLWSVGDRAAQFAAFCSAEYFAIHILAASQRRLSDRFAQSSAEKYDGIRWDYDGKRVPRIAGCLARFQCRRHNVMAGGDHKIILGEVESFEFSGGEPLMFVNGQYLECDSSATP